jgi:hypothetical protein
MSAASALPVLLPLPWEASPAPPLPQNATIAQRADYYASRKQANDAHERSPEMMAYRKLRRRDDESDPAPGIPDCHNYLLAKFDDPLWLTKQLTVLLFANKALSITAWGQHYREYSEVQTVNSSLAVCVKLAVLTLRSGGVDPERYFAQKTIESFHRFL